MQLCRALRRIDPRVAPGRHSSRELPTPWLARRQGSLQRLAVRSDYQFIPHLNHGPADQAGFLQHEADQLVLPETTRFQAKGL